MDGPPLVVHRRALPGLAGSDRVDARQPAQSIHPHRRSGLLDLRGSNAGWLQRRENSGGHPARRGALPGRSRGRAHRRARGPERHHVHQPDQLRRRLRAAGRLAQTHHTRPARRRAGAKASSEGRCRSRRDGDGAPAPPNPWLEPDRWLRVDDRGPLGQRGRRHPESRRPVPGRRHAIGPSWPESSPPSPPRVLPAQVRRRSHQGPSASMCRSATCSPRIQANLGGYYINDFDLYGKVWKVMLQAEGSVRTKTRGHPESLCHEPQRPARSVELRSARSVTPSGRSICPTTTSMPPPK